MTPTKKVICAIEDDDELLLYWQDKTKSALLSSKNGRSARKRLETSLAVTFASGFGCDNIDLEEWQFRNVNWPRVARFLIDRTSTYG